MSNLFPTVVIMRGLSGSGKSTRAKVIQAENPGSVIFSTDEYFMKDGEYKFQRKFLHDAHNWNQLRFQKAVENAHPFIIVDNTNTRLDEIVNYSDYALGQGYRIKIEEPDSPWWKEHRYMFYDKRAYKNELKKFVAILAEKNSHGVPEWILDRSLRRWQEVSIGDLNNHFADVISRNT